MSLRHLSILLTLGPAFFISAVASQQRKTAASLAVGPPTDFLHRLKDETPSAVQDAQIKAKKRDWKKGTLFFVGQLVVFAFFFYSARNFPDATNYFQIIINTWMVAFFSETSLREILGVTTITVTCNSEGKLVGSRLPSSSTPSSYLLTLLSFTIFPLALLSQSTPYLVMPLTSISTLTFTFFFARTTPHSSNTFSLRWIFFLFTALEALVAALTTAIFLLVQSSLGDGLRNWMTKEPKALEKADLWLRDLVLSGVSTLHPLWYFGLLGWLVGGLYRLDVSLRGSLGDFKVEEFGRLPAEEPTVEEKQSASEKKPLVLYGERIVLPPLSRAIARHRITSLNYIPVYFLTGVAIVVGLVAIVPVAFSFSFSEESLIEAQMDYYLYELIAVFLSPPLLALAVTVVASLRGETSKVWSYREAWGGVKPAPSSVDDGLLGGEDEKTKNEEVEVDERV